MQVIRALIRLIRVQTFERIASYRSEEKDTLITFNSEERNGALWIVSNSNFTNAQKLRRNCMWYWSISNTEIVEFTYKSLFDRQHPGL